jgi:hypothetical protein
MTSNEPSAEVQHALEVARQVMVRRKNALEALAQMDAAEHIMREDADILAALAKGDPSSEE